MATEAYNIFKTKPFDGWKMQMEEFKGKRAVAVPKKKIMEARASNKDLCIIDKTSKQLEYMILDSTEIPLSIGEFEDKWGRQEKYQLYYYIWTPTKQLSLL
jgi:hypothetical protein